MLDEELVRLVVRVLDVLVLDILRRGRRVLRWRGRGARPLGANLDTLGEVGHEHVPEVGRGPREEAGGRPQLGALGTDAREEKADVIDDGRGVGTCRLECVSSGIERRGETVLAVESRRELSLRGGR